MLPRLYLLFVTVALLFSVLDPVILLPVLHSLPALAQSPANPDLKAEAERLMEQGNEQFIQSEYQTALQPWQQALDLYRQIGDQDGEARSLNNLGEAYRNLGQYLKAIEIFEQSLVIFQNIGNGEGEARSLMGIGNVYRNQGQYPKAIEYFEQSLAIFQNIGDREGEARSVMNLGTAYNSLGQYPKAIASYEHSLAIFQNIGDREGEAYTRMNLGNAYSGLGQYSKAIEYYEQSLAIQQDIGDREGEARSLMGLGNAYRNLGQYQKSIEFYEQSLGIQQDIGERSGEARSLIGLGNAYSSLGRYPKAIKHYEQSLVIFQDIGDRNGEARSLMGLGLAYSSLGQYIKAIEYYEQSLAIQRDIGDRNGEARSLNNLGTAYSGLGQYPKAIKAYEQSLVIFQDIGDRNGEALSLMGLGLTYNSLGQYSKAIESYEQALVILQNIGDRNGEALALMNLGNAYTSLSQYLKAIEYYEKSLSIQQDIGDRNGEARSLMNLGNAYSSLSQYLKAIEYYEKSLPIQQDIGDRNGEALSLNNLGEVYHKRGQYLKAIEYYEKSLAIQQDIGDREGEGITLSNVGNLLAAQNQPEAAIVFLKQSVNVRETIRQDNRSLPVELQQSYTNTVSGTYRRLSELLLARGRILEAQQVLELLKLQELRDFTGVRAKVTANGIELTAAEQAVITQHSSLITFGQQVNQCQKTQCSQLTALLNQRDQLTQQFNQTLQSFETEMRSRLAQDRGALDTQDFSRSAREIVEAQPGTVMIYAVVLDNKLWLLWATAGGVVNSVEVPVTRQQLGETVLQFRQLLSTPNSDITQVQATAKQLYDWLIAPIASELQKNQIQYLVFSLDRVTRYIPMAALFDGQHYLLENYTVSTVLSADLTRVDDRLPPGTDQTSVLALGLSNPVPPEFPGLPNVPAELNAIVRSADDPQGIYPGLKFLNQQFDENTLRNNLFGHQIVHIATHGVFVPGRQDQSYLVLGNGQQMSISRIQELQDLGDVKLVVLSACQTALGEPDQDGLEIAGIAYYFLNGGANAVMASLWAVNDASTQQLMQHLYTNLAQSTSQVPVTRAEALRQAQLSLLQGSTNTAGNADRSIVGVRPVAGGDRSNAASPGLSHPYYWAPFILIGNGL